MDDLHSKVLRKFHTLCSLCGMSAEEKRVVVESCGVESSADIDTHRLIDLCGKLSKQLGQKSPQEMDRLRKQVFAAIGGYLRMTGRESSPELIKGIACRQTGYESFNKIPAERLRNVYHTWRNKQKDHDAADAALTRTVSFCMATPASSLLN